MRFQFCLAAESIGQDGAIMPYDSQSNCEKAGQDELPYNDQLYHIT